MKKSLLAVLLAVVLVTPVFANMGQESKFDVVGKLGAVISPSFDSTFRPYNSPYAGYANSSFAIALEGYYKFDEKLAVGLGISHMFQSELSTTFDSDFVNYGEAKLGFTNIYVSLKPSLSENIYAIGQIGYGISSGSFYKDANQGDQTLKVDGGGLYFGLGAGVEYKSFLFEVLYSINTATFKEAYMYSDGTDSAFKYSAVTLNVGYKFSL